MRTCHKMEKLIPLYLEGSLSEKERREVEEHLSLCSTCRASLRQWQRCFILLRGAPRLTAPPGLWEKVRRAYKHREERRFYPKARWIWLPATFVLTAVLLVILWTSRNLVQETPTPAMPPAPAIASLPPQPSPVSQPKRKPLPPKNSLPLKRIPRKIAPTSHAPQQKVTAPQPEPREEIEEKVFASLQMALKSAQMAEDNLSQALHTLQNALEGGGTN